MPSKFVGSPEELSDKLNYNPSTGILMWKSTGKKAGSFNNGYLRVGKHGIYAHRIAFYKMKGCWPEEVDHKDHNGLNNRWENLRETNRYGNNRNIRVQKNNKTGVLHVHKIKSGYSVRIGNYYSKSFTDFDETCKIAKVKRKEFYGEYA